MFFKKYSGAILDRETDDLKKKKKRGQWRGGPRGILYHRIYLRIEPTTRWTVNLLGPRQQWFIKLNLMGEQSDGPDESRWSVCLVRDFGDPTLTAHSAEPTSPRHRETELTFVASCVWISGQGGGLFLGVLNSSDWHRAAWYYWQDSAPDLNCGHTHTTNPMPGLPSFPCDLRSNPQRKSHALSLLHYRRWY